MPEQEILERRNYLSNKMRYRDEVVFKYSTSSSGCQYIGLAVPEEEIEQVAEFMNAFAEVNHNS